MRHLGHTVCLLLMIPLHGSPLPPEEECREIAPPLPLWSPLLQAASMASFRIDAAGIVRDWNAAAETLLGRSAPEAIGLALTEILPLLSGDPENPVPDLSSSPLETSIRRPSGEVLFLAVWHIPGTPDGRQVLVQDVTTRKFLETALVEAAEREQHRIGQELHDHLCQHLLGAAFAAKALGGALDQEQSPYAGQLHDLARLINDAVRQVREISRGLHPVELDAAGLMTALQQLAERSGPEVACVFRCDRHLLVNNTRHALHAYRIAQAGVTAALQETKATNIEITLSRTGASFLLQVTDNGTTEGELTAEPTGVAAQTLFYRARAMHGSLAMKFEPTLGTRITCLFPA